MEGDEEEAEEDLPEAVEAAAEQEEDQAILILPRSRKDCVQPLENMSLTTVRETPPIK